MLAHVLALALVAQVASDGLTISPAIPPDLATWRWTQHDGKAALGWGRLNDAGQFVAARPRPPWPLYPDPVEAMPEFATNGVVVERIDSGLTLRASDQATAAEAGAALRGTAIEGPFDRPRPPLFAGPDWTEIGLYAIAASLFALSLAMFIKALREPPLAR